MTDSKKQEKAATKEPHKPRLPATPEAMIVELESMCLRWRWLNQQLTQKPEPGNKRDEQLVLGDLPISIRIAFTKAARAIDKLETTIDRRRKSQEMGEDLDAQIHLVAMVEEQLKYGNRSEAKAIASTIRDGYHRGKAFYKIAYVQVRSCNFDEASQSVEAIEKIASALEDNNRARGELWAHASKLRLLIEERSKWRRP